MTMRPGSHSAWLAGTASWFRVTAAAVALLTLLSLVAQRSSSAFSGPTGNSGSLLTTATLQPPTSLQATTRCVGGTAPTVVAHANSSGLGNQTVAMPAQV